MKTTRFFSFAAFAAITFTFFACSSDDPDDNTGSGVNPSEYLSEDRQVYLMEENSDNATKKYDGSGVVYFYIYPTNERIQIGEITDGIIKLNSLPNINSESLQSFSGQCKDFDPATNEDYSSCNGSTSASPPNLLILDDVGFEVDIPDCYYGYISLGTVKSGKWSNGAELIYASQSGSITGTENYTYREENGGGTRERKYEWSFEEGWNIVFVTRENRDNIRYYTHTSNIPAGTTLEWGLECYTN